MLAHSRKLVTSLRVGEHNNAVREQWHVRLARRLLSSSDRFRCDQCGDDDTWERVYWPMSNVRREFDRTAIMAWPCIGEGVSREQNIVRTAMCDATND
jgi:hypothetical protein